MNDIINSVILQLALPEEMHNTVTSIGDMTSQELLFLIGDDTLTEVPNKLSFILVDVIKMRMNALTTEGFQSESQDGYSLNKFSENDFSKYSNYIRMYQEQNDLPLLGATIRFLGKPQHTRQVIGFATEQGN